MAHPKVSICCITYNHEQFISQALDSFLMQETDFPFEIVIGDDCSTDNTPIIIEQYRLKHPNIISVLERKKNLGSEINFVKTIEACHGEYVALCEGDDFWTDPKKIQKQADKLGEKPTFSVCVTNYSILDEVTQKSTPIDPFEGDGLSQHIIEKKNIFNPYLFQTHTIFFRKKNIRKEIFQELRFGDVFLAAELLTHGNGIHLSDDTGVYRQHKGGMFSQKSTLQKHKIEYYRSEAMFNYFKNTYPQIDDLHKWNTEKLKRSLKQSGIRSIVPYFYLLVRERYAKI
jgi:glycosyltransferase involved in cell wall biosynthesis